MSGDSSTRSVVRALLEDVDLPADLLSSLTLPERPDATGPVVPSSFRLGTAAQASIAASALSALHIHELRTGTKQVVTVDERHAALEFTSEAWAALDGNLPEVWDPIAGVYPTEDGHVRIHTNFPHHKQGILDLLQCQPTRESVGEALRQRSAQEFEEEAVSRGMCVTALRSFHEWQQHPQAQALQGVRPITIVKIAEAPKRTLPSAPTSPLDGIKVLDLTRVLAGPICGRTLAAHGADVLWVTSPALPALPAIDVDTSRGKRTTQLNLDLPFDRATLDSLLQDADVFLQAYRPGSLARRGYAPQDVVNVRPGIVYASVCAYGWEGPWKERRGFDSLVQTATGFNIDEADAFNEFNKMSLEETPRYKPLPFQALDHAAGQLLACGIIAALSRTIADGGSWEVRVSLAGVGQWLRSLGRFDPEVAFGDCQPMPRRTFPPVQEIQDLSSTAPHGGRKKESVAPVKFTAIRHAAILSETPVREGKAPLVLNAHKPEWLPIN
ncbi:hypothetical protein BOTBODRAFT_57645 [Botryobasidium botryosum FD-172 SS1]|uniref:CoA-transferase family III n=1 Tax=Botryobasidium botryosum (strain FD-172 SS1) TaxID=930990 RepID=A0A067MHR3_BOTB1|nr:hypothetical protein BOTBODRAFT_57645 [Botryobasidium botryosum FD-172 SS1]